MGAPQQQWYCPDGSPKPNPDNTSREMATRIFLRNSRSRKLRAQDDSWTCSPAEAVQYASLQEAGEAAIRCGEEGLEVVLQYDQPACELALNPKYCL